MDKQHNVWHVECICKATAVIKDPDESFTSEHAVAEFVARGWEMISENNMICPDCSNIYR